jgi:hypothetical protein
VSGQKGAERMIKKDSEMVVLKLDYVPPPVSKTSWQEMEARSVAAIANSYRLPLYLFYKRVDGKPLTEEKYSRVNLRNPFHRLYIWWLRRRKWHIVRVTLSHPNSWIVDKDSVTLWMVR